jgi:AbrB family looped-hinge helix DNA binding protein
MGSNFLTFSLMAKEDFYMPLVKVKEKFQVTLPVEIRQKAGIDVGDLLEASVQGKRITLVPKVAVDRAFVEQRLAEGLEDLRKGRVYGPFTSSKALVRSLHRESRKLKKKR